MSVVCVLYAYNISSAISRAKINRFECTKCKKNRESVFVKTEHPIRLIQKTLDWYGYQDVLITFLQTQIQRIWRCNKTFIRWKKVSITNHYYRFIHKQKYQKICREIDRQTGKHEDRNRQAGIQVTGIRIDMWTGTQVGRYTGKQIEKQK